MGEIIECHYTSEQLTEEFKKCPSLKTMNRRFKVLQYLAHRRNRWQYKDHE